MDKSSVGPRKVLRAPALRRGREIIPISNRVKLERVIGLTVSNNAAFDCDPNSGIVAYPAGCVVVVYNVRKNKQGHILSSSKPSKKTITSLAFSSDGKYLATGECGHQPHVRVWDVQEKTQVAEFQGHKYGINCVAFSPNMKYVISVGSQHDMIVNVWDWKNNIKVASNKVSCKVKALSFASNGNYFVTVGNRHVKFWYLECSRSAKYEPVPLMGRSAILGDQRNNYFCDVACGKGEMVESTYAITKSGLLCEFNNRRLLDKWVELRTTSANSISVGDNLIVIGCGEGVIRCFNPTNLNFISTLPRPHTLGIDVAKGLIGSKPVSSHQSNAKYPDTIAVALDEINRKVTCIYNDHSFYVWDIKDVKKVGKSHSFMYHSACIWGIEVYPEVHENDKNILPKGTFLTCSSDDTIRFWNLETEMEQDTMYHKNVYSSELLKVLYVDPELSYLCDTDLNSSGSNDKVDATYDGKNGVRCLRISPDGRSLASGDRSGNIRIHDLEFVDELCKVEAHDSEVLCLEYSKPISIAGQEKRYLASASRDRLIHVFDVKQDYTFQQTLDDHSSSITAVRFVQSEDTLQMISCGADKSIIFRKAMFNPQLSLLREHHVVGKTTLYDMEVDTQQKHILTACQDRNIRVYSVQNGKHIRCFRGSQAEDGTLIKVVLDSSGTYLATSCTDKSLYLYDYITGECLATMFGHSELVTGLKFTNDGRHLISVSGDGCIFVWKLPTDVTQTMLNKQILVEGSGLPSLWQDGRKSAVAVTKPLQIIENGNGDEKLPDELDLVNHNAEASPLGYRFSMGQLPLWAKKQMLEKLPDTNENQNLPPPIPPRGRWAQRIDGQGLVVRSYLDGDSVIPFPNPPGDLENSVIKEQSEENSTLEFSKVNANLSFEVSEQSVKEILNGAFTEKSHGSLTFGQSINSLNSLHNRRSRLHSVPNTSSMRLEDVDAEDERSDSEVSEMVYYPVSEDGSDATDVAFQVCGNSERNAKDSGISHTKKPRPERMLSDVPVINTPEQETNSDEEDFSPMVDSDRSFLSSLCVSTENLERLGQREKFMKSNYESLEKGESVESHQNDFMEKNFCRQSISAKYLAGSTIKRPLVNGASTKPVAIPERQMSTPTRKREELLKALSDAKKKLETVGFRRGLSSSKSIADLHSTPDREMFTSPRSPGEIRKASSMTDLSFKAQYRGRIFSPDNSRDESEAAAPLWNQSKMYPIDTSPPDSPNLNSSMNSCSSQAVRKETTSHPELVSRSNSSSSLYNRSQNASSGLYKTSSVYSLDRASPRFNANLSLYRSSQSPSGRPSLPSIPPKPSMVPTALATDSSSDSSPSESPPIKSGRPVVAPRPFPLRNRHFSLSESNHSDDARRPSSVENGSLQKLRLKSRSEWDLKNSLAHDSSKSREDSWQSSRYLSFSPRKNYMRPLKLGHTGVSALHSTPISTHSNEEKDVFADQIPILSLDPSSVPLTLDLCDNIANNLIRVSSFAMEVYQRLAMSSDVPLEEKTAMSNTLDQSVSQAQQILRPAIPPSWLNYSTNEPQRLPGLNFAHTNGNDHLQKHLPHSMSHPEGINTLLEQYSNQLLRMVEQKMSSCQDKPNNN